MDFKYLCTKIYLIVNLFFVKRLKFPLYACVLVCEWSLEVLDESAMIYFQWSNQHGKAIQINSPNVHLASTY